ncbi:diguanylate cyclase domain-containing protein [uncultured Ruminococcus sp.]|uniref:diguanylate cyclase domain-containing protein n=1 Tax=uncultured Ruminococcus sp. TaxID=165186 RepID=UPI0025FA1C0A|nr:diguanylate cyclase [uncultured Ruminococcus sp.]
MDTNERRVKTGKRNFIFALVLLLLTNIVTSAVLTTMSKNELRKQIEARMLDVANTAADMVNGDTIANMTNADVRSPEYNEVLTELRLFQTNIELSYIYCVRRESEDNYIFVIDPDMEDPAEFGEDIPVTPELKTAAGGKPAVESTPHTDEWGTFYSAYSPVFDSSGKVVGIIGVDFNAEWYNKIMSTNGAVAVILAMVALCMGIVLSAIIMSENRKRFYEVLVNMKELERETERLDGIIMKSSIKKLDMLPDSESALLKTLAAGEDQPKTRHHEYDELSDNIRAIYNKLSKYLNYIDKEVYTDSTTGVNNKAAYRNRIQELDVSITTGKADFSVAFFDINGIKKIYTHYGFEAGDRLMYECAKLLKDVFGKKNVYHVTGDEFVILIENTNWYDMEKYFKKFDKEIEFYNGQHQQDNLLSVAKGTATYDSEKHRNYRQVFVEAEAACKHDKESFYGDMRK